MLFTIFALLINKKMALWFPYWFVMDNEVAAGTCIGHNVLSVMIWLHLCTDLSRYILSLDGMMLYKIHTFVDKMCSHVFGFFIIKHGAN